MFSLVRVTRAALSAAIAVTLVLPATAYADPIVSEDAPGAVESPVDPAPEPVDEPDPAPAEQEPVDPKPVDPQPVDPEPVDLGPPGTVGPVANPDPVVPPVTTQPDPVVPPATGTIAPIGPITDPTSPASPTSTASPTAQQTSDYPVHGPNDGALRFTKCSQFDNWRAAQAFYLEDTRAHARFDRDGDGIACEEYFTSNGRPRHDWSHYDPASWRYYHPWRWYGWHWGRDGRDGSDGRDGRNGRDGRDGTDRVVTVTEYVNRYLDAGGDPTRAKTGQQVSIYPVGGVATGSSA